MKSRATLVLTEQLVMLLTFSLAAALCLGIFAGAHRISRETRQLDDAVILVRNGAETLKAAGGNMEATARTMGGSLENGCITVRYDRQLQPAEDGCYILTIRKDDSGLSTLGTATVQAYHESRSDTVLFSVTAAWQEVTQ